MSERQFVLHLSTLQLTIRFQEAERAYATLQRVWEHTQWTQYVPTRHQAEYLVEPEGERFRLRIDGGHVRYAAMQEDVPPLIEGALYTDLLRTQQADGLTILHASCCVDAAQRPFVFAGVSGSGKSALARAAVEQGMMYLGDEHIVTDGSRIWGLPRAIHMDVQAEAAPRLPWHAGADLTTYRCRNAAGQWFRLPFVPVPRASVAAQSAELERAVVVDARRGAHDAVEPMNAAARLRILDAAHFVPGPGLGRLALVNQAFALTWSDPGRALHHLRSALR